MPLEAESAALGAALQAAAVHSKVPIAQYVQEHQPPMAEQVRRGAKRRLHYIRCLFGAQVCANLPGASGCLAVTQFLVTSLAQLLTRQWGLSEAFTQ